MPWNVISNGTCMFEPVISNGLKTREDLPDAWTANARPLSHPPNRHWIAVSFRDFPVVCCSPVSTGGAIFPANPNYITKTALSG